MGLALVQFLSIDDLEKIKEDEGLLEATRKAAEEELIRRNDDL